MTQQNERKRITPPGERAYEWWRDNCESSFSKSEDSHKKHDPAIRARLRRCRSNTEAAAIPAAVSLAVRLQALRKDVRPFDPNLDAALGLARVLAFVTENTVEGPMRAAGWKHFPAENSKSQSPDDQPQLAEARFRRLLGAKPGNDQVVAFVRLVTLLRGSVNVAELSRDFLQWGREDTRRRWAFDYYAASIAAPSPDDTPPSEGNV